MSKKTKQIPKQKLRFQTNRLKIAQSILRKQKTTISTEICIGKDNHWTWRGFDLMKKYFANKVYEALSVDQARKELRATLLIMATEGDINKLNECIYSYALHLAKKEQMISIIIDYNEFSSDMTEQDIETYMNQNVLSVFKSNISMTHFIKQFQMHICFFLVHFDNIDFVDYVIEEIHKLFSNKSELPDVKVENLYPNSEYVRDKPAPIIKNIFVTLDRKKDNGKFYYKTLYTFSLTNQYISKWIKWYYLEMKWFNRFSNIMMKNTEVKENILAHPSIILTVEKHELDIIKKFVGNIYLWYLDPSYRYYFIEEYYYDVTTIDQMMYTNDFIKHETNMVLFILKYDYIDRPIDIADLRSKNIDKVIVICAKDEVNPAMMDTLIWNSDQDLYVYNIVVPDEEKKQDETEIDIKKEADSQQIDLNKQTDSQQALKYEPQYDQINPEHIYTDLEMNTEINPHDTANIEKNKREISQQQPIINKPELQLMTYRPPLTRQQQLKQIYDEIEKQKMESRLPQIDPRKLVMNPENPIFQLPSFIPARKKDATTEHEPTEADKMKQKADEPADKQTEADKIKQKADEREQKLSQDDNKPAPLKQETVEKKPIIRTDSNIRESEEKEPITVTDSNIRESKEKEPITDSNISESNEESILSILTTPKWLIYALILLSVVNLLFIGLFANNLYLQNPKKSKQSCMFLLICMSISVVIYVIFAIITNKTIRQFCLLGIFITFIFLLFYIKYYFKLLNRLTLNMQYINISYASIHLFIFIPFLTYLSLNN